VGIWRSPACDLLEPASTHAAQSWPFKERQVQINNQENRVFKQRDERIIDLVSRGLNNRDIAREIGTTEHVVKNYLRVIYDKLGMWSRLELALWHISRRPEGATEDYRAISAEVFSRNRERDRGDY
jgi:DNA-binding NarL/FixJ family response regulator